MFAARPVGSVLSSPRSFVTRKPSLRGNQAESLETEPAELPAPLLVPDLGVWELAPIELVNDPMKTEPQHRHLIYDLPSDSSANLYIR